jgi:CrcB protein
VGTERGRGRETGPALSLEILAAAAAGAVLGVLARYGLSLAVPHEPGTWPWATLAVNLVGCLLVGLLVAALVDHPSPHRLARPFLVSGVLGGFTTFSALALETRDLVAVERTGLAAAYVGVSLVLGLALVSLGRLLAQRRPTS